ncbi:MAG: hypothetical protein A3I39_01440 [Candidatus Yanofskybacteria bacterium RIFCSPLOWO2_02_FULL_47_9b]|uniref:Thioredoxin domain-containing protein n=1 Tax=Candidatus Yanofskybacteria bacterium RIFCSPLOWO2_02_FULL_47_9b TaxID=1802708 RepID=A0A1F8H9T3_9BACT|nr:MAG: hypothetical protein A3I39_01440 [Candidatus Yanofskybacteria bacterium RIFCSPLOWO2_02_FULL_47_9b]
MSGRNPNELTLTESVSASDHAKGTASAKAVLVEYGDYQCPACYQYEPLIKKLLSESEDKVNFVFRNFPLPQHGNSNPAHYTAEAAALQGKFWEMHDIIYENQLVWSALADVESIFLGYAQTVGLDIAQYQRDIASKQVSDRVAKDLASGRASGVNSTPTFFLNGKSITVTSYEQLKQLIESAAAGS